MSRFFNSLFPIFSGSLLRVLLCKYKDTLFKLVIESGSSLILLPYMYSHSKFFKEPMLTVVFAPNYCLCLRFLTCLTTQYFLAKHAAWTAQ